MSTSRLLFGVLCDDVRIEVGHKHSLMGLFDTITVTDFGQPLPSFHVFARLAVADRAPHDVVMELRSAEGDFHLRVPARIQAHGRDEATALYVATLNITVAGVRAPRAGTYHVAFLLEGDDLGGPSFVVRASQPPTLQ